MYPITLNIMSLVQEQNIIFKANLYPIRVVFTFVFTKFRLALKVQVDFVFIQVLIQVSF